MKRLLLLLAVLAVLAVAAGCGDDEVTAVSDAPPGVPGDGLVLRVDRTAGFTTPELAFAMVPSVSIYADGRVLTPGATIEIYPGPALVPVYDSTLDAGAIADLVALADELGLADEPLDFGQPPVADAGDTVVTIVTDDGAVEQVANALHEGTDADESALTGEQRENRERLLELVRAIEEAAVAPDSGGVEPFVPDAYLARASTVPPELLEGDPASEEPQPRFVEWPAELLPPADIGACTVFEADAAEHLGRLLAEADQLTYFTDAAGEPWRVTVRPVLPDESGCGDRDVAPEATP